MKFNTIFEPNLYSVIFDNNTDEFEKFLRFLTDATQLEVYFNENRNVLKYYNISIEDAIEKTLDLSIELYEYLKLNRNNLDKIFEPLKSFGGEYALHRMKFKSNWIRVYAIKIESKYFVITGGVIKQSNKMKEHIGTQKQLVNLSKVREYLLEQGIVDVDGFFELINEKNDDKKEF
jgi:hypothetical protein